MNIGDKIKEIRISKKISQKQMALMLQIPVSTLANYENNHRKPPIELLSKIADALEVNFADLIGHDNKSSTTEFLKKIDETIDLDALRHDIKIAECIDTLLKSKGYNFSDFTDKKQEELQNFILEMIDLKAYKLLNSSSHDKN